MKKGFVNEINGRASSIDAPKHVVVVDMLHAWKKCAFYFELVEDHERHVAMAGAVGGRSTEPNKTASHA